MLVIVNICLSRNLVMVFGIGMGKFCCRERSFGIGIVWVNFNLWVNFLVFRYRFVNFNCLMNLFVFFVFCLNKFVIKVL